VKTYKYGVILGVILAVLIVTSNVILPSNGPDSSTSLSISPILIGGYIIWASFHAGKASKSPNYIYRVGALTSLIGFLISMATFFVVDNAYLNIVSRQTDKIIGFSHSHLSSMQVYINQGLFTGLIIGIPASIVFGLACGLIARKLVTHQSVRKTQ